MNITKIICNSGAKLIKTAAVSASNSTSLWGFHQPKEPKALKNLKK